MNHRSDDSISLSRLALEAVENPSSWQLFVEEFGRVFRATFNTLMLWRNVLAAPAGRVSYSHGMSEEDLREWQSVWVAQDPWMSGKDLTQMPVGKVVTTEQLCPEAELIQTEIYRVFMKPRRIHHGGGVNYLLGSDASAVHTVVRPKEEGPLRYEEIELWHSIVPTVQSSVRLSVEFQRLRDENRILEANFEASGTGLIFLTGNGSVIRMNRAAQDLLHQSKYLRVRNGALTITDHSLQRELLNSLEEFARPLGYYSSGAPWKRCLVCRDFSHAERSLLILLTRLTSAEQAVLGPNHPVLLAYLVDPHKPFPVNTSVLAQLFDLTPSEIEFSQLLASGISVSEACAALGITENTGRTHLKRIFSKTGVQRQGELVALLLSLSMRSSTPITPIALQSPSA